MERLTKRFKDGSYTFSAPLNDITDCLAAYEDTGLSPEEVAAMVEKERREAVELAELCGGISGGYVEHIRELLRAERDGRLVVLPCKVGDTVYRFEVGCCRFRENDACSAYCEGYEYSCPDYESDRKIEAGHFCLSDMASIGKTVFLTREEAEAALKEQSNDKSR